MCYTTELYDESYSIRANWAEASCPIERKTVDGWESTGMQVADYRHSAEAAMRAELEAALVAGGNDPDDHENRAVIDTALAEIL